MTRQLTAKSHRTAQPPFRDPADLELRLPPCEVYQLSNGVSVYALNMGTEESMMIDWVFFAGNSVEQKKTVAAATNQLLKNGTHARSAFEINEHFEFYGAWLNRHCYNETSELVLHALSKHAGELIPVVAELISDSIFPEKELAIYIQNARQRLEVNLQKCDFVASRLIDAHLFGEDHPYGRYSNLTDYSALQREDLLRHFDAHYRQGRCVIFAAGNLPPDLPQLLEKEFGRLPLRPHPADLSELRVEPRPSEQKKHLIINDSQGVQAAIRIARHFPNRHHPDFQKALVLNNLFGGYFGSRLMANIREDKGYTYGIYSYLMNHIHQSGWVVSTEAGRDVSVAAVSEVYAEMKALREAPVDEEELRMTRNYMIGTMLGDLDGPFQVLARWKNLVLNGLGEAYFYRAIETIRTIRPKEIQELAEKYLVPEDFYELVVI